MSPRFATLWFPHLITDWVVSDRPALQGQQFVLAAPERGRMIVKEVSRKAKANGIQPGMVVADARALFPALEVIDEVPGKAAELLEKLSEWCIRYTPIVAPDPPDGLILDSTGCAHLWGGELRYLHDLLSRLRQMGYEVNGAIADTIGAAWAVARFGKPSQLIGPGSQLEALLNLPPAALRLEPAVLERMHKLGLYQIRNFIQMQRTVLRRRFGQQLLTRIDQALGHHFELIQPFQPLVPYQERLPCMEPIVTATGIQIALRKLLEMLCSRLVKEGKGLRTAVFKGYRVDGKIVQIDIVTTRGSFHVAHLFSLFELKIRKMEPALGIELFSLEAPVVEDVTPAQEAIWVSIGNADDVGLTELLDRLAGRSGIQAIRRFLPAEHHWPERSIQVTAALKERPQIDWRTDRPRPMHLLSNPENVDVTALVPDYPPLWFTYRGRIHIVKKADGPERIEREWWLEEGLHRDYYCIEDQDGDRYWIFRLGHYDEEKREWFIHGFFA